MIWFSDSFCCLSESSSMDGDDDGDEDSDMVRVGAFFRVIVVVEGRRRR